MALGGLVESNWYGRSRLFIIVLNVGRSLLTLYDMISKNAEISHTHSYFFETFVTRFPNKNNTSTHACLLQTLMETLENLSKPIYDRFCRTRLRARKEFITVWAYKN